MLLKPVLWSLRRCPFTDFLSPEKVLARTAVMPAWVSWLPAEPSSGCRAVGSQLALVACFFLLPFRISVISAKLMWLLYSAVATFIVWSFQNVAQMHQTTTLALSHLAS